MQYTTSYSNPPSPTQPTARTVMDDNNNNSKRQRETIRDGEELHRLVKRPRNGRTTEQGAITLRSVAEIVFETADHVGDASPGSFAAFYEPDPEVTIADGRRMPTARDAPVRFYYSWDKFEECMRGRLGSRHTGISTYCCVFVCASETARPLLPYKYHFGGQVGFGSLVQLLEARLVGRQLPVASDVLDEATVSVRFFSSDMSLSGDYLVRVDAGNEVSPDDDHVEVAE